MKIAHISDSHFDERNRLADTIAVHDAFLDQAADEGVDLIVHAGDWFERKSSPKERLAVLRFLQKAQDIAPIVGAKGNHDAPEDLELFTRARLGSVHILERPGVVRLAKASIYCLPWFDKQFLSAWMDASVSSEGARHTALQAASVLLEGIGREVTELRNRGPVIVVAHCMVSGSETSTGQTLQGVGLDFSPSALYDLGADYVALGHIHKAQSWHDGRVRYSGSPSPLNYGEPEQKGWVLATIEDCDRSITVPIVRSEFRPLPARKMLLIETDHAEAPSPPAHVDGALVRIRVKVPESRLATFDAEAWKRSISGAHEVKVEPVVIRETRARAPEISTQESIQDKVCTYLDAKSITVDRESLASKLETLEAP